MATPPEILFLKIAINAGYIDKDKANDILAYQKKFAEQGQQVFIVNYVLAKKILTPQQVEQIKNDCQKTLVSPQINKSNTKHITRTRKFVKANINRKNVTTKRYAKQDFTSTTGESSTTKQDSSTTDESSTTKQDTLPQQKMFGHYRIEKEIGQGGMGSVYKVYDTKLQRSVALKIISTEQNIKEKRKKRFLQEIKATAQLSHPHIVSVLEAGDSPQSYFTMEYLEGGSLSDKKLLKPVQIAIIIQKIAEALHYAHKNGIIHRDIKPSNIMFNSSGEPKLMDFGLSKMLDVEDNLSKTGEALGTPAYMPPEQANGTKTGPESDIYSLGATLYEVLTGKQLFEGESYYDILNKVFHEDPILPREIRQDIPRDLQAICLKAIQKKPQNRYVSARNFAKDLRNFIEHRSVSARPTSLWVKFSKFTKRYRTALSVTFIISIFCIIGFFGYMHMFYNKQKYLMMSLYDLQNVDKSLRTNPLFFQQLNHAFAELDSHYQIRKVFREEPKKALLLHLWAMHSIETKETAKKWIAFYDNEIRNHSSKHTNRVYYYGNRGYLYLQTQNHSKASKDFNYALQVLKKQQEKSILSTKEDSYLLEFCSFSKKQIQNLSKGKQREN